MRDFFQDTKLTGKHFRVALLLSFMLALLVALILSQVYRMRYSSVMETYNKGWRQRSILPKCMSMKK